MTSSMGGHLKRVAGDRDGLRTAGDGAAQSSSEPEQEADALIIGGGVAGVRAAIALKRAGVQSIIVLEKSDQLGGVWHHNRYPGVACDVPSPSYSYGFRLNDWSRLFAEGAEICEYFQRVAAENDVVRHVRFNTELLDAAWDDQARRWVCDTTAGRFRSQFLILATGTLHSASVPDVPGKGQFSGRMFHSSEWPTDFDPAGKRVAVVGTGASAIQFIPKIQSEVDRLVVLQRTPPWIIPKFDVVHPRGNERRGLRRQRILRTVLNRSFDLIFLMWLHSRMVFVLEWMARTYLRKSVRDRTLRAHLTPDYVLGCKRMLMSSNYYSAVSADNVDYVASGLSEIRPNSVVASDGREFEVDTVIWATGFRYGLQVLDRVRGRDGKTLGSVFAGSPRTYLGTTMAGCPNAFLVAGPHTGSSSIPFTAEVQSEYVASAITTMRRRGLETVEVRPDAEADWMRRRDAKVSRSVWNIGGCNSYYLNAKGENLSVWPGTMKNMARALGSFDVENYLVSSLAEVRPAASSVETAPAR